MLEKTQKTSSYVRLFFEPQRVVHLLKTYIRRAIEGLCVVLGWVGPKQRAEGSGEEGSQPAR